MCEVLSKDYVLMIDEADAENVAIANANSEPLYSNKADADNDMHDLLQQQPIVSHLQI